MERTEHAPSGAFGRLAGGLLIAESVFIFVYPQVWALGPDGLTGGLWYSILIALVASLPPLLVGVGLVRRSARALTVPGIIVSFSYAAISAQMLASTSGPFTALWVVILVSNIVVLGILGPMAAVDFFRRRSNRSGTRRPVR